MNTEPCDVAACGHAAVAVLTHGGKTGAMCPMHAYISIQGVGAVVVRILDRDGFTRVRRALATDNIPVHYEV